MATVNSVRVISSVSGAAGGKSFVATNVVGGIASVTSLNVSGVGTINGDLDIGGDVNITNDLTANSGTFNNSLTVNDSLTVYGPSNFVGIGSFDNDLIVHGNLTVSGSTYVSGDVFLIDDLSFDEFIARNGKITGILTVSQFYYDSYYAYGIPYFDSDGFLDSTQSPENAIDYSNYILTTDEDGIPTWTNCIDGGEY